MTVDMDYMQMLVGVGVNTDAMRINYNVMCYTL